MPKRTTKNLGPKFQRTKEDFTCKNCGRKVQGNGYTNHCPGCLWSKHVDDNPGDRASECGGMMEPSAVSRKGQEYVIIHLCKSCGFERANKLQPEDDFALVITLASSSFRLA